VTLAAWGCPHSHFLPQRRRHVATFTNIIKTTATNSGGRGSSSRSNNDSNSINRKCTSTASRVTSASQKPTLSTRAQHGRNFLVLNHVYPPTCAEADGLPDQFYNLFALSKKELVVDLGRACNLPIWRPSDALANLPQGTLSFKRYILALMLHAGYQKHPLNSAMWLTLRQAMLLGEASESITCSPLRKESVSSSVPTIAQHREEPIVLAAPKKYFHIP
jgi:hypothetical protein